MLEEQRHPARVPDDTIKKAEALNHVGLIANRPPQRELQNQPMLNV